MINIYSINNFKNQSPAFTSKYPKLKKSEILELIENGKTRNEIIDMYNGSEAWFFHTTRKYNLTPPRKFKTIKRVEQIKSLFEQKVPMREILEQTGLSKHELAEFIKRHFNRSIKDFKQESIIELYKSNMSIDEICKRLDISPYVVNSAISKIKSWYMSDIFPFFTDIILIYWTEK